MKTRIRILLAGVFIAFGLWTILTHGHDVEEAMEDPVRESEVTPEIVEVASFQELVYLASQEEFGRLPKPEAPQPKGVMERLEEFEREKQRILEERDKEREELGLIVLDDGSVLYMTLDDVKACIDLWYTEEEIDSMSRMVNGEDGGYPSQTVWAADAWVVLNRLGKKGFSGSHSILSILYSGAFDSVTKYPNNMKRTVRLEIREMVVDVLARKVYEDMGAPPEAVGRVLPEDVCYFRNPEYQYRHNHFYYSWKGSKEYDPFAAPYNPYTS